MVNIPASLDQSSIVSTSFPLDPSQSFFTVLAFWPTMYQLVFFPERIAVAVPAESGTCLSTL